MSNQASSVWETITPDRAKEYLKHNKHNRAVKVASVDRYSRDMVAGRWKENGESLKFDTNGFLVDGQNRLMACLRAGVPFRTLVIRGVSPDVRGTVDANVGISFSDLLTMEGKKYANIIQAVCRLICLKENDHFELLGGFRPSMDELRDIYQKHGLNIEHSVNVGRACRTLLPKSLAAFLHHTLFLIDPVDANIFFSDLATGANLDEDDPVQRLRERLIKLKVSQRGQLPRTELTSLVYRAWNARRENRKLKTLGLAKTRSSEQRTRARKRGSPGAISIPQPI